MNHSPRQDHGVSDLSVRVPRGGEYRGAVIVYQRYIKRIIDFILAFAGGIILFPLFLILFILIKIDSPGKSIFKQRRIGRNEREFYIYKFRTMRIDTPSDTPTHMLSHADEYITRTGKFLRKTSLDELPQIFNILKGDMSIVGPRPALWNQYDLISLRRGRGLQSLRPGLTGWAQINGRDELEIPVKVNFDAEYLENISFRTDVKIFFCTLKKVVSARGIVEGKNI